MNNKNSSLHTGYKSYSEHNSNELNLTFNDNQTNKDSNKKLRYPYGITPLILNLSLFIGFILFSYFYGKKTIQDSFVIGSAMSFFGCVMWSFSRYSSNLKFKYSVRKYFNYITFKEKRKNKSSLSLSLAINNVNNFDDYEKYIAIKKRNSTISYFSSIIIFTILFIVSIIVSLTIK